MEVGSDFVADAESFELVEPGEYALNYPSCLAESGSVGVAASGDAGCDAALSQQATVLVVVVAAVGEQSLGSAAWAPAFAPNARQSVEQGDQLGDVVAVAAGERDGQGVPCRSTITWCLEPGRPRSTGEGPTWSPL